MRPSAWTRQCFPRAGFPESEALQSSVSAAEPACVCSTSRRRGSSLACLCRCSSTRGQTLLRFHAPSWRGRAAGWECAVLQPNEVLNWAGKLRCGFFMMVFFKRVESSVPVWSLMTAVTCLILLVVPLLTCGINTFSLWLIFNVYF